MLARFLIVAAAALALAASASADGIFAKDANKMCNAEGKAGSAATLQPCCRQKILSGGLFGPNDPDLKKEVDKCVAMGQGGAQAPQAGGAPSQGPASGQAPDQAPPGEAEKKKEDCETDGAGGAVGGAVGGAIGGSIGGAIGGAVGGAADATKCK